MSEERPHRQRVLKGAHVVTKKELSAIACTMRDLSENGARLHFEQNWLVPDRFTLMVDVDGYKIECERIWQRGSVVGVKFTSDRIQTSHLRGQVITEDKPAPPSLPKLPPRPQTGPAAPAFKTAEPRASRPGFGKLGR